MNRQSCGVSGVAPMASYEFDRTFGPAEGAEALFEELRPVTRKLAQGGSATVLAYGQVRRAQHTTPLCAPMSTCPCRKHAAPSALP